MDEKFPNGNDDEITTESSDEEVVLFTKGDDEAPAENLQETPDSENKEPEESAETEKEPDIDTAGQLAEKKAVEAPAKTKSEKTQTIVFFTIIGIGIIAVIALLVVGIINLSKQHGWFGMGADESQPVESASVSGEDSTEEVDAQGYSKYLNDNGFIKDVNISDYVELCDYENIVIDYADIKPDDSEIQEQIDSILSSYEELSTDTDAETRLGDTVNIDYVGTVDGVAFEGGDTKGAGTDLELGSGSYIDDFEEQLVGHKVGDNVTVEVTFPENYGNEELNGKDAVFEVTINGIYTIPELTDDFVKENLSDYASTADGLKAYIEESLAENNKKTYIWDYVKENSEVKSYPEEYFQNEYSIYEYELENQYNYYDQYYYSAYGQHLWNDIYEFYEVEESEYGDMVNDYAENSVKQSMIIQAIAEDAGIEVTDDDTMDYITGLGYDSSSYDSIITKYGKGYVCQNTLYSMIENKLIEEATVKK